MFETTRPVTAVMFEDIDNGLYDTVSLCKTLLSWMSEDEVFKCARANDYIIDYTPEEQQD